MKRFHVTAQRKLYLMPFLVLAAVLFSLTGCGTTKAPTPYPMSVSSSVTADNLVKTASSQIGTKYRYGGTAPGGFDCSGLIWWTFQQNGIAIPRTSSDQADMGISVRRSEMQKGDVLVFRTSRTGTHTALYIGSDNFIHSPKPGKRVKKDTLKLPYWNDRLIAVRRILY
ncbi:MAG: C40 family peptidase [Desulfovibrionaceae bacterium]|nr:C40 family peptidase [Desulfovibrionaceae bacterium]